MRLPGVAVPAETGRPRTSTVDTRRNGEDQKTGPDCSGETARVHARGSDSASLTHPPPVCLQYPPGYLAAMANKTKKEACTRPGRGGRSKHYSGRGRPRRQRKIKEEKEEIKSRVEGERPVVSVKEEAPQNNVEEKVPRGSSGGCFCWCRGKRAGEQLRLLRCPHGDVLYLHQSCPKWWSPPPRR